MNEPTRVLTVDADRLAALEQRVGALVEIMWEIERGDLKTVDYHARLAALRAPGDGAPDLDARDLRNLRDSYKGIAQVLADAEIEPGHSQPDSVRLLVAALATARRERDETIETCRETISRQREMIAARDAEIAGLKEQLARMEERQCDLVSERDEAEERLVKAEKEIAWLRSPSPLDTFYLNHEKLDALGLSKVDDVDHTSIQSRIVSFVAEVAGIKAKLAEAERALMRERESGVVLVAEKIELAERCVRLRHELMGAQVATGDALARIAELEARDREGRWLAETEDDPWDDVKGPEYQRRRAAYLSGAIPADPARGLIERCVPALEAMAPDSALLADLRAYLGGG